MSRAWRSEWTKFRTAPGNPWLVLGVVVATVAVSAVALAATPCPSTGCDPDHVRVGLTGVQLGQAVAAILGALMVGDEYATGMIRVSLAATPVRGMLLAAKATILTAVVTLSSAVAVLGCVLMGGWSLADGPALRASAGSVLYLDLIALLAFGTATAVRNSVAAMGIVLGLLFVFPIVAAASSDPAWRRHLEQIGPMSAGLAIQRMGSLDHLAIQPWNGLAVLAAWSAAALLAGFLLLTHRDV